MVLDLNELAKRKFQAAIKERDERHLSPDERADLVGEAIFPALGITSAKEATSMPLYWDLVCFSLGIIRGFSMAMQMEEFDQIVRILNSHLFSMHYSFPKGSPALGPNREEQQKEWESKIEFIRKILNYEVKETETERELKLVPLDEGNGNVD